MTSTISVRPYGRMVQLQTDVDSAVQATTAALSEQGVGVLATIDVDQVLKEKIGLERDRYTILGACNPELANQGLNADIDLGLLLPCCVTVREGAGQQVVTSVDPKAVLGAAWESSRLEQIAVEPKARLAAADGSLPTGWPLATLP